MKKVTAFLLALILFLCTVAGIHVYTGRHVRYDAHSFGSWISQYKFFAGAAISANMDENSILVLGSSEFRRGRHMSSHPANLFKDSSVNMMMVGAGYYQSLFHAVELAAVSEGVKNRKAVLILSPQWFKPEGVLAPAYASRFSDNNFIAMLENQKISRETKRYIADRSEKLLKGDPQTQKRVQRYKRVFLDGNASFFDRQYVRHYRSFLREKNQISLCAAAKVSGIEKYKPKTGKTETPDWKRYDQIAQQEGEKAAQGNPFYVSHKVYEKQILPHLEEKKGSMAGGSYASSPEYGDLECFLRVCRETGIKPMLVLMPVNGYWYDYTGFSAKERQKYYDHIRKAAEECGAELADFSTDEYTPYFFLDKVHLGWKGWLAVDESIYNFAKKDSKQ